MSIFTKYEPEVKVFIVKRLLEAVAYEYARIFCGDWLYNDGFILLEICSNAQNASVHEFL